MCLSCVILQPVLHVTEALLDSDVIMAVLKLTLTNILTSRKEKRISKIGKMLNAPNPTTSGEGQALLLIFLPRMSLWPPSFLIFHVDRLIRSIDAAIGSIALSLRASCLLGVSVQN